MFDDLRQQTNESAFQEQEDQDAYAFRESRRPKQDRILGMTAAQRFVIALMLLMMAVIMSTLILLVTEKVMPPFM